VPHRRTFLETIAALAFAPNAPAATPRRVIVIGAGIMGASIAYHLAKRGAQVIILEKERPGAGATKNSFAWLNAGSKRPRSYYELNLLGIFGWRRLQQEIGFPVQWGGSIEWAEPGAATATLLQAIHDRQQLGYAARIIDEPELHRLLTALTPGPVGAACHNEIEGTVDPVQALNAILAAARQLGVTVEYPCEVTALDLTAATVKGVQTTSGPMQADAVVLAGGVGIPKLAASTDLHIPLVDSPGILAHTAPHPELLTRVALGPQATIKQNPDGRFVTGQDFGGTPGVDPTREVGNHLLANASRFLPALKTAKLEEVTLGHRVLPKDGHPIVGFSAKYKNLYVAAMHSGMTLSPVIGQFAAMEILDGITIDLLADYRPARFA
jgi:glycine/D-amino acid oxidase-like deaminating enzyme